MRIACSDSDAALEFSEVTHAPGSGEVDSFLVRLSGAGLSATARVYGPLSRPLPAYFAELADRWRGWEGATDCATLDGELRLSATHDGRGNVLLAVALVRTPWPGTWTVETRLVLEAGGLDDLAAQAAASFAPRRAATADPLPT